MVSLFGRDGGQEHQPKWVTSGAAIKRGGALAAQRISAPAHPPQHVGAAATGPGRFERALAFGRAVAPDGLAVTGRAPLHAAARMMDAAQRGATVAALLRLVTVTGTELLAPRDRGINLPVDDHGVGQATDSLGHFATAVRTNGHDSPLLNPVPIISGPCDIGADTEASPALTCAHDDCEERRGPRTPGGVVLGQ